MTSSLVGAKLYDISRKDGLRKYIGFRKGPSHQEREPASKLACILGIAVSDLLLNNVVHTSTAVERFRVAHCVYSGLLPGDIETSRLHLRLSQDMFFVGPSFRSGICVGQDGALEIPLAQCMDGGAPNVSQVMPSV